MDKFDPKIHDENAPLSFEPLGYGNRWYDRVIGRRLKSVEILGIAILILAIILLCNV